LRDGNASAVVSNPHLIQDSLGHLLAAWLSSSYSMPGPVSTGMRDHLWVGKPLLIVTSHSGQLSLLP